MTTQTATGDRGLVGREPELDELQAGLDTALSGHGRLILLAGEAGIGKSRLTDEIAKEARGRGARVLFGRCWEAGGAPPYWPWVQVCRAYLQDKDDGAIQSLVGANAPHLVQMLPELEEAFKDLAVPTGLDPESARFRLFEAATLFLGTAARRAPLVLILEDLHAADEPSLLLLQFLTREIADLQIFIVATYRDTELRQGLSAALAELARQPVTRRRHLGGLSQPDVATLIESATGIRPRPEVIESIYADTEGNPLFVVECARLLAAEGKLGAAPGPQVTIKIPDTVREVIRRRLSHLTDGCRELLAMASVLGRDFSIDPLLWLNGWSSKHVMELLDEAVQAQVATEVAGTLDTFRFAHALIRDTLYDEIPPTRRAGLHSRVGDALERLYGDSTEPPVAELAHHFFLAARAGRADKSLQYLWKAADLAASRLAYEEAARQYEMALQVLELKRPPDEAAKCEVLLRLGDALARAGNAGGAKDAFLRGAEIARRRGLSEELARAALGYGGRFVWEAGRGDPHLVPLLEDALAALQDEQSPLRARLMARLAGGPLRDEVNRERRAEMSQQAVELARRLAEPATLAYVLDGRYAAVWWPDNLDERLEIARELVEASEAAGDKERAHQAHHYRCLALLEQGDMSGVHGELDAKRVLAEELRQPAQRWYVVSVEACLAIFGGRFDAAEELIREIFDLGRRSLGPTAEAYMIGQLYSLRRLQGRLQEVEPRLEDVARRFPTYPVVACQLAHAWAELGKHEEARELLLQLGEDDFARIPKNAEWLFCMVLLSEAASLLGDGGRAEALYDALLPYRSRNAVSPPDACTGSVERNLGLLSSTLGRLGDADAHFRAALEWNQRMGATPWVAMTQHQYAELLLSWGEQPQRERAIQLGRAAYETARTLGMEALIRSSSALLGEVGEDVTAEGTRTRRTFMFTDIVRSTSLVEAMGDQAWHNLRAWHDRTLRSLFTRYGGEEVDHAGDGFFVAFREASAAAKCAMAIQRALADHRRQHGFAPSVRIGIHAADAVQDHEGYGGRGVHEAARIGALAEGDEIIASLATAEEAPDLEISNARTVDLKGVSQPVDVVNIRW